MGKNSLSDYASHYWSTNSFRARYTWSSGIEEESDSLTQAFYSRQAYVMLDRPQIIEGNISGPAYTKETPNAAYYTPPLDKLDQPAFGARSS